MQGHEPSLVQRAVAGDEAALTVLLTQSYADMMDRLAGRTPADLRPVLDPEDIVQETHVEVFRHIGDFEATLPNPDQHIIRFEGLRFTPDGSTLVAGTPGAIQLWNLGLIRKQLQTLGLDW